VPKVPGKVGHLIDRGDFLLIEPSQNLDAPVPFLLEGRDELFQLRRAQVFEIGLFTFSPFAVRGEERGWGYGIQY